MFLIDIAVPRDIEPEVNQIEDVFLYDIDDLQSVVAANMKEREKEAEIEFTEVDVKQVMDQTNCSEEDAIKALEETGDLAEAILSLS